MAVASKRRPVTVGLYAPLYNGIAAGIALGVFFSYLSSLVHLLIFIFAVFVGNALRTLLMQWVLGGAFTRLAICAVIPFLFCVSLVRSLHFGLRAVLTISLAQFLLCKLSGMCR